MMEDGVTTQVGEAQRTTVRCFDESTAAQLRELLIEQGIDIPAVQ